MQYLYLIPLFLGYVIFCALAIHLIIDQKGREKRRKAGKKHVRHTP